MISYQEVARRERAGLSERIRAGITDVFHVVLLFVSASFALTTMLPVDDMMQNAGLPLGNVAVMVVLFGLPFGWLTLNLGIYRATAGMRNRHIEFRGEGGAPLTPLHACARGLLGLLLFPLSALALIPGFSPDGRSVLDRYFGTIVVRTK